MKDYKASTFQLTDNMPSCAKLKAP